MLREHYPVDKYFEEILEYIPELSPELEKINSYLEDEKLYRLIQKDLAQRRPKTSQTGRNSTPVEVRKFIVFLEMTASGLNDACGKRLFSSARRPLFSLSWLGHQRAFDGAPATVFLPASPGNGHFDSLDMIASSCGLPSATGSVEMSRS